MNKTEASTWPFGKPSERRALEKQHVGIVHAAAQLISSANEAERELEDVIEALRARVAGLEAENRELTALGMTQTARVAELERDAARHDDFLTNVRQKLDTAIAAAKP